MAKRPAPRRTKPKKPAPKAKPKAKPARKPKPAAKRKPAPQAKPKAAKKKAARTKPARTEAADRPKVIVFGIDEIPQIARMADAFALAPAVRRSQIYFHDSAFASAPTKKRRPVSPFWRASPSISRDATGKKTSSRWATSGRGTTCRSTS
jgi:outer membrane biosynthesis protein TonB